MERSFVPLNDLQRHVNSVIADVREAVESVFANGQYILGPSLEQFESNFAAYCGVQHAVGVANGTDALELALYAAGCKAGDEVITVANAGGYATNAIIHTGATPVYADIDPHTWLMTADTFVESITDNTRAVVVPYLFGLMAHMPSLCQAAKNHGITVIEDCAQAHGASIAGKKAGSWGALGCFSFYPTKNLGALGDAGCIVTNDDALAKRLRGLRQYGWEDAKYHSPRDLGRNSRMDDLQAAILLRLLPRLDEWNHKRRHIIQRYKMALASYDIIFQHCPNDKSFAAHLCAIQINDRQGAMEFLAKEQIASAIHYPIPDYAQPAVMAHIGRKPPLPVTQKIMQNILTIPCFPEMTEEEINRVITAVKNHSLQATP